MNNDIQDLKDNDFDEIKLEILKNMDFIEDLKKGGVRKRQESDINKYQIKSLSF